MGGIIQYTTHPIVSVIPLYSHFYYPTIPLFLIHHPIYPIHPTNPVHHLFNPIPNHPTNPTIQVPVVNHSLTGLIIIATIVTICFFVYYFLALIDYNF